MSTPAEFCQAVEGYLQASGLSPSTFGTKAAGDPNFVFNLRGGREPRSSTVDKIERYMHDNPVPEAVAQPTQGEAAA